MKKVLLGWLVVIGLFIQPVASLAETVNDVNSGFRVSEEEGYTEAENYQPKTHESEEVVDEEAFLENSEEDSFADYSSEDVVNQEELQNGIQPAASQYVPTISYRTHIQTIGWQGYMTNGQMSGTTAKALRLEGIQIKVDNSKVSGGIQYQTHIQDIGWQAWKANNDMSGTSGQAKRLEGIKINLTGQMAQSYDVYYRVHAQNFGWLGWAKNGASAGTAAYGFRLEGIQITLVNKGGASPGSTANPFKQKPISVNYQTHIQTIGWQNWQQDGGTSGTSGKALRLEGIKVKIANGPVTGGIQYRTHVQNIGWQGWKTNADMSGTSGKALRLEAIQMQLTGELAKRYDVYYRVHSQNFGWLDWAKNGASSGTEGYGFRLESIQIKLVEKGKASPGKTVVPFTALKFTTGVTDSEKEIARSVNVLRHTVGELPLTWNGKIYQAAKIRTKELEKSFSHTRPNGSQFHSVFAEVGYDFMSVGENIAMSSNIAFKNETHMGQRFYNLWYNSPGHYTNMVRNGFDEMGIATFKKGANVYAVQLFGSPY